MVNPISRGAALGLLALTFALPVRAADTLLTLTPRPGATLRILVDKPANPTGSVILFAGNDGVLDLDERGNIGSGLKYNHLIRTRASYVAAGYATFTPDVASDLKGTASFRDGDSFAGDLALVVREARKLGKPVAVIGTSRGARSVAAVLVKQAAVQPDAAVISSGVLMSHDKFGSASSMGDWSRVRIPVLLLRHAQDDCRVTPPGDADRFKLLLAASPRVDIITMSGGGPATPTDKCGAEHYHGFYGIDDKVVQATVNWLKANMK
jgi:dienelactone hydrolase